MFERIGQQLRHQHPEWNGEVETHLQRFRPHLKRHVAAGAAAKDVARQFPKKRRDVEGLQVGRVHQLLVNQSKRVDPIAQFIQCGDGGRIAELPGLQHDQAIHDLKVVLHPVVDLPQQQIALSQGRRTLLDGFFQRLLGGAQFGLGLVARVDILDRGHGQHRVAAVGRAGERRRHPHPDRRSVAPPVPLFIDIGLDFAGKQPRIFDRIRNLILRPVELGRRMTEQLFGLVAQNSREGLVHADQSPAFRLCQDLAHRGAFEAGAKLRLGAGQGPLGLGARVQRGLELGVGRLQRRRPFGDPLLQFAVGFADQGLAVAQQLRGSLLIGDSVGQFAVQRPQLVL